MVKWWKRKEYQAVSLSELTWKRFRKDKMGEAKKSHAISNFRMAAGEESGTFYGMVFQDSDVAKWLEAAAYSLLLKPDEALNERVDELVALIGRCQQEDGYLNTYFTVKEPGNAGPFFGTQMTGGAWLSSARVVRCWVKSRNERNPCS